jgi:type I restriction-modification system DNA methylase subunit
VADRLRGDYKQSDYGKVIVPFTVLPAQLRAGAQQHLDSE